MVYGNPEGFIKAEVMGLGHDDLTPAEMRTGGDHFAHAAGRICKKCDRPILADQPARKRGEASWAHDVCPD
jgi:hypothetical protein